MKASICLLLAGLLSSTPAFAEPTHTVLWWRAHAVERTALLEKCRNDPGRLRLNPDCVNAERAQIGAELARKNGIYLHPITREDLGPNPFGWKQNPPFVKKGVDNE